MYKRTIVRQIAQKAKELGFDHKENKNSCVVYISGNNIIFGELGQLESYLYHIDKD